MNSYNFLKGRPVNTLRASLVISFKIGNEKNDGRTVMRQIIFAVVGCAFVFTVVGCETIKGIGKDIENTGRNIQEGLSKDKGGS